MGRDEGGEGRGGGGGGGGRRRGGGKRERGGGWGCTQFVHGRSRMTIDSRVHTMPGGGARRGSANQAGIAGGGISPRGMYYWLWFTKFDSAATQYPLPSGDIDHALSPHTINPLSVAVDGLVDDLAEDLDAASTRQCRMMCIYAILLPLDNVEA